MITSFPLIIQNRNELMDFLMNYYHVNINFEIIESEILNSFFINYSRSSNDDVMVRKFHGSEVKAWDIKDIYWQHNTQQSIDDRS